MRVSKSWSRNRITNSVVWYIFIFELAGAAGSLSLVSLHFCFAFAFRFAFIFRSNTAVSPLRAQMPLLLPVPV